MVREDGNGAVIVTLGAYHTTGLSKSGRISSLHVGLMDEESIHVNSWKMGRTLVNEDDMSRQ